MICHDPYHLAKYFLQPAELSLECIGLLSSPCETTQVSFAEYLKVFLLTCILEFPFYYYALKERAWPEKLRGWLIPNLVTHPAVYFFFPWAFASRGGTASTYAAMAATAELFAPAVEALLLCKVFGVRMPQAVAVAIFANLFSWGLGCFLG